MSLERSLWLQGFPDEEINRVCALSEPHPPAAMGLCAYCTFPLQADQPTSPLDEPLSHVGCAVMARRTGARI